MKKVLAVTMGDAAGIGPEVIVRALEDPLLYQQVTPVVYGDRAAMEDALRITGSDLRIHTIAHPSQAAGQWGQIDLIDLGLLEPGSWQYGKAQALTGEASFQYITRAIADAMVGHCTAVATAPISKEAIHLAGHAYSGHTEIFAEQTGTQSCAMLLTTDALKVIHVTTHISMREACDRITTRRVLDVICLARRGMRLLGCEHPRISVAGFNAHCSENGLFGDQEALAIRPAVEAAQAMGLRVDGPVPPDTVFCKAVGGMYDIVVAMYHDQGHIPIKLLGLHIDPETNAYTAVSGVNCSIGLPFIRTSVDHGTAYDKAGLGLANGQSMAEAIRTAATMARNLEALELP